MIMKQFEAKELSELFASEQCKYGKCKNETMIKIVRIQMIVDPIAETIRKSEETARKTLVSPEFKQLSEDVQAGKIKFGTPEAIRVRELDDQFVAAFSEALEPIMNKEVEAKIEKFTIDEFKELFDSNKDFLSGSKPKLILTHLVDV